MTYSFSGPRLWGPSTCSRSSNALRVHVAVRVACVRVCCVRVGV